MRKSGDAGQTCRAVQRAQSFRRQISDCASESDSNVSRSKAVFAAVKQRFDECHNPSNLRWYEGVAAAKSESEQFDPVVSRSPKGTPINARRRYVLHFLPPHLIGRVMLWADGCTVLFKVERGRSGAAAFRGA